MSLFRVGIVLLFVLVASGCLSARSWEATRLLRDIEAGQGTSELKRTTPAPSRRAVAIDVGDRRTRADLYEPGGAVRGSMVVVHGFTPEGKNDPRLVALAQSLARVHFRVLAPDLPGSKATRVAEEDGRRIADAMVYLADLPGARDGARPGLFAISYAVGLAVLATTEPRVQDRLGFLVSLGGYYDVEAVIRFITTGDHGRPGQRLEPMPAGKWVFLASNLHVLSRPGDRRTLREIARRKLANEAAVIADLADGLSAEGRAFLDLITNREPARVSALLARLPQPVRAQVARLSPSDQELSHLDGRLILIHGREDRLIPYTQSIAFDRAVEGAELFLIEDFSHIDPSGVGLVGRLSLIDAASEVLGRRK